jgi:hypothetical protein
MQISIQMRQFEPTAEGHQELQAARASNVTNDRMRCIVMEKVGVVMSPTL